MIKKMVASCCAYNCTERFKKNNGLSFHSFPRNKETFNKWVSAIGRANFKPTRHSLICSKHFLLDCYNTSPWSHKKSLKPDAVPTIFDFSSHSQVEPITGNLLAMKTTGEKDVIKDEIKPLVTKQHKDHQKCENKVIGNSKVKQKIRKSYIGDIDIISYSEKEQNLISNFKTILLNKKKVIKTLQQKNRRLEARVNKLKKILKQLQEKNVINRNSFNPTEATNASSKHQVIRIILYKKL